MTKTVAFYDPFVTGHHVEYLYHIANAKINKTLDVRFIFIVNRKFDEQIKELIPTIKFQENHIEIIHIEDYINESDFFLTQTQSSYRKQLKALNEIILKENIHHCVFMYLDNNLQIALGTKYGRKLGCSLSGILLNPFGGNGNIFFKYYYLFRKILQNYIMLSNRKIKRVYIIINKRTVKTLMLFHITNKFIYVSDPIFKSKYLANINPLLQDKIKDRITFLLFGTLNKRKGIFTTLNMLSKLTSFELSQIQCIFAGKLASEDKNTFLEILDTIKMKDENAVKLVDRYIDYKDIPTFFEQTDYVLLPYNASEASSGVLGHAAYYEKPVIGQGNGILQKHIKMYTLGKTIKNMDCNSLTLIVQKIIKGEFHIEINKLAAQKYINSRDDDFFASTIINNAMFI